MNWKPIPKEEPAKELRKKTHVSAKFIGSKCELPSVKHPKISYRLFQKVSGRLLDFVRKEKHFQIDEISLLINEMQQTVLNLQKKKQYLMEKKMRKGSKPFFVSKKQKHRKNNQNQNSSNSSKG